MKIAFRHVPFSTEQIQAMDQLARSAGYETIWCKGTSLPSPEELAECEVLMGYFPPDLFKSMPKLRWVQTPAAGVERLCSAVYASPDVQVTNCSGAFGIAIAEYMLTGLLMLMRLMPAYMNNQKEHRWQCMGTCRSIYGSRITVVGMGDIGSSFAARAKAMGAHIRGVRRTAQAVPENYDEVFTSDRLVEAVQGADAVVLCLPGTPATTGLISAEVIDAIGSDTIVVNCGRGYTVDQDALVLALQEKRLGGAVLDVAAAEPLPADSLLWDMENVIITPHISGHDDDPINIASIYAIFCENLKRWIEGKELIHKVDRSRGY